MRIDYPEFTRDAHGRPLVRNAETGALEPMMRPSHFEALTDEEWLGKWKMRQAIQRVARNPSLVEQAARLDIKKDAAILDMIAEDAMRLNGSSAGADRGTHLHQLTEALDWGEPLPPCDAEARADIDAYRSAKEAFGITVVPGMIEVRAVNDEVGCAGTIDRIIHLPGLGTVIGDLKCGQTLRFSARKYAVQLALYARSVLYDPATGERRPMPEGMRTDVGVIIWLPAGQRRCEIHTVNLEEAWRLALLSRAVHDAREADASSLLSRRFPPGLLLPGDIARPSASPSTRGEAAPAPEASTGGPIAPEGEAPTGGQPASPARRQWVLDRLRSLPEAGREDMALAWPEGIPPMRGYLDHTDEQLAAITRVLDRVEAKHSVPFGAPQPDDATVSPMTRKWQAGARRVRTEPDEGAPADPGALAALRSMFEAQEAQARDTVHGWLSEAHAAGRSFSLSVNPSVRRFEILRACIWAATSLVDDELVRAALAAVTGSDEPLMPTIPTGAVLGALATDEALRLVELAEAFAAGRTTTSVDDGGAVRFPVAA